MMSQDDAPVGRGLRKGTEEPLLLLFASGGRVRLLCGFVAGCFGLDGLGLYVFEEKKKQV